MLSSSVIPRLQKMKDHASESRLTMDLTTGRARLFPFMRQEMQQTLLFRQEVKKKIQPVTTDTIKLAPEH